MFTVNTRTHAHGNVKSLYRMAAVKILNTGYA